MSETEFKKNRDMSMEQNKDTEQVVGGYRTMPFIIGDPPLINFLHSFMC